MRPAVRAALEDPAGAPAQPADLGRYVGIYETVWGQEAIIRWGDGIAMLGLGSRDPKEAIDKLSRTGEHSFRRVRDDDGSLGEEIAFEVDGDGAVRRMLHHSNWSMKVQ